MTISVYSEILKKIGTIPSEATKTEKKSREWLRKKITSDLKGEKVEYRAIPGKKVKSNSMSASQHGFMVMFKYDAKHKEKLPYFDRFPIVFPFSKADGGFLGINLHYLAPYLRARLMDELYKIFRRPSDEQTKIRLSYQLLQQSSKFNIVKPCIKHYLFAHIKTMFITVPEKEWPIVLFLPTEDFVKYRKKIYTPINKRKVWGDSSRKAGVRR